MVISDQGKAAPQSLDNLVGVHAARTLHQDQIAFPHFFTQRARGFVRSFKESGCVHSLLASAGNDLPAQTANSPQDIYAQPGNLSTGLAMHLDLVRSQLHHLTGKHQTASDVLAATRYRPYHA